MSDTDALRDFMEELRDRAATARRNADTYAASGYRGEALLLEERARALEAAAELAEDKAQRLEREAVKAYVDVHVELQGDADMYVDEWKQLKQMEKR